MVIYETYATSSAFTPRNLSQSARPLASSTDTSTRVENLMRSATKPNGTHAFCVRSIRALEMMRPIQDPPMETTHMSEKKRFSWPRGVKSPMNACEYDHWTPTAAPQKQA